MLIVLLLGLAGVNALNNGVARTPPMGWLSWVAFGCNTNCTAYPDTCISESLYMAMADHMADDGYAAVGYEYVNVDDCWSAKERDANGNMVPDPERFPSGISGLAAYVHSKGLKLGLYSDIGNLSCGGYPGMEGHFQQDVETFAAWGIDSLKVDGCSANWLLMNETYPQLSNIIMNVTNTTGRPIMYSCSWPISVQLLGGAPIQYQRMAKYCNLWRNYDDINSNFPSVERVLNYWGQANGFDYNNFVNVAQPGAWNDPDQLLVGLWEFTLVEEQTQMGFWALFAAPMLMSNDLRNMSIGAQAILQNTEVIAINQDVLGKQGRLIYNVSGSQIWHKPLVDGSAAVVLFNRGNSGPVDITLDFLSVGFSNVTSLSVRDLFAHEDLGIFVTSYTGSNIPVSGIQMIKIQLE